MLEDAAEAGADGDPHLGQVLGLTGVLRGLGGQVLDVRQGPFDSADEVGEGDLGRVAVEPVAAAGAAAGADQAGVLQLEQDVLQELKGDALGLGEALALDRALSSAPASSIAARTA